MKLTYLGTASVLLEYSGQRMLTDPVFDPSGRTYSMGPAGVPERWFASTRSYEVPLTTQQIGHLDAVLLSHHSHRDNLDYEGLELIATGIPTLSTRDAASDLFGGSVIGFDSWEIQRLGDVTITAVPALHGPPGSEPWVGKVTGFVLEAPGEPTVYVSGDNASLALVEQIANRFPEIDIAVLFAGAATVPRIPSRLTLSAADARQAAELLGASRVVGLHTEDWEHFAEDAAQFAAAFEGSGLLVPTPRGETVTLAG